MIDTNKLNTTETYLFYSTLVPSMIKHDIKWNCKIYTHPIFKGYWLCISLAFDYISALTDLLQVNWWFVKIFRWLHDDLNIFNYLELSITNKNYIYMKVSFREQKYIQIFENKYICQNSTSTNIKKICFVMIKGWKI